MLPIPWKYGSQRILPMANQREERLLLGHNRGRHGHQPVTVRASSFRSSSVLHIAARVRDLFPMLSFLFWISGSSWDKEKVRHFDESFASSSLARKKSYILHCAIHINKHIWQSENCSVWGKIWGACSCRETPMPICPISNVVLQIVVTHLTAI